MTCDQYVRHLEWVASFFRLHPECFHRWMSIDPAMGVRLRYCLGSDLPIVRTTVRAVGGKWTKKYENHTLVLSQRVDGVLVSLVIDRSVVCTQRVVGHRTVTRTVPAQPAREATEAHTETVTEDIVEWDCGSVLRSDGSPVS